MSVTLAYTPMPVGKSVEGGANLIIDHLRLRFVTVILPPSRVFEKVAVMAAEERAEHFLVCDFERRKPRAFKRISWSSGSLILSDGLASDSKM